MALGNYGIVRPANFDASDCEIFYLYSPSRVDVGDNTPIFLNASQILSPIKESTNDDGDGEVIGGLYNLKLPYQYFSNNGIYNLVIRPKKIKTKILDCGTLSSLPNVKGLVLDMNDSSIKNINSLDGYRIEYIEDTGLKKNFFRIVTSSNRVEPVSENITSSGSQKTIRYRLNESGSLIFLTLTPSSNNIEESSITTPFIGYPNQQIYLTNTFFDPIMIEIEIVEDTIETLANALYGSQIKQISTGKYGMYDKNNNLFKAFNLFEVLNEFGEKEYEIKQVDNTITQEDLDIDSIINQINNG